MLTLCSEEIKFLDRIEVQVRKSMIVRLQSVNHWRRVARSRALAYVLLVLIGFSSTVGLTHRHGNLPRNPSQQTTFSFTETSDSANINVPSSTTQDPTRSGDCPVCQFQRTLSNAEIFTPVLLAVVTESAFVIPQLSVSFVSRAQSIVQGRAPPITF